MTRRNGTKTVTMATIAREAGVARTTVSFVLSGQHKERGISDQTAERIRDIAAAHRFVPNESARSLSRRRSGIVGVFIPGFNSAWGESVVRGIRNKLYEEEAFVPLIASQHDEPDSEEREVRLLIERRVEAIVCCPTVKTENYRMIQDRGIPLVFIGHRAPGLPDASFVAWDGAKVAASAVKHLVSRGRTRIAFVGRGPDNPTTRERCEGYLAGMKAAGLEVNNRWKISVPDYTDAGPLLQQLCASPDRPDAILSDLWLQALSVMETLDEINIRIPEDVALLALGDSPFCRHARIAMSCVVEPAEKIGNMAAEIALALIKDPSHPPVQKLVDTHAIIDRRTT